MESERDVTTRISERQMRLWNALHPKEREKRSPHRFLTISRDEGTLGNEIAQVLAQRLGWRLYDKEIVNKIANNSHVREEMVRRLDERSEGTNDTFLDTVLHLLRIPDTSSFGTEDYHESLLRTLAAIAAQGDAILVGRGANFALQGSEHGFHVRIAGSPEVRAQRLGARWQVTPEKARRCMQAIDAERRAFIHHHFRQDFDDIHFYTVAFNTDHLSVRQVVTSILSLLNPEVSSVQAGLARNLA